MFGSLASLIHEKKCGKSSIGTPQNLNKLAELVRGEMPKLNRRVIGALITIDVHARDIVTQMVTNEVCTYCYT